MATTVALTGPFIEVTNDKHDRMYLGRAREHDGYAIIVAGDTDTIFSMTADEWQQLVKTMDAVV